MRRRLVILTLFIILLTAVVPLQAQNNEDQPLMALLALIPDTPEVRQWGVSYMDYRAVVRARLGDLTPTRYEELYAEQEEGGTVEGIWRAALNGIASGPADFPRSLMMGGEEMAGLVGFDFFDVGQGATYLAPPITVAMFRGNFDEEVIDATLLSRDYQAWSVGSMPLWCPVAGCDTGAETNIRESNLANPFGGQLGRKQPILLVNDILMSSTSDALLRNTAYMMSGTMPTLASAPDIQAAVRAVTQNGQLIQAHFYDPFLFVGTDVTLMLPDLIDPDITDEERQAAIDELIAKMEAGGSTLPYYSLVVLADVVDNDAQFVHIGLVYTDAEIAQVAADVVYQRMQDYQSIIMEMPLTEIFLNRTAFLWQPQLYTDDVTGLTVVLLTLRAPMPPNEIVGDAPWITASSMVFSLVIRMVYSRDMGWLAVGA